MSVIEKLFESQRKLSIVFTEIVFAPWRGMNFYSFSTLCGEFFDYSAWKRICESPRYKYPCFPLLPMR
jgi:hypothetical protein